MAGTDVSTIALAVQPAVMGDCGLCLRESGGLNATLVVSRGVGTVARFDVCENCDRAIRRLAATTPGLVRLVAGAVTQSAPTAEERIEEVEGPAVPIHEYAHPIQAGDGALYLPVSVGVERHDGTWVGWLEFREIGGARVLRTNRETTQPNHGAVAYWASGLQPSYIEGAFRRARRPHTVQLPRTA